MIVNRMGEIAKERGLSAGQVTEKAGISYNTALNIIRGVATRIDLDVLDKVCSAFDVEPGEILIRVKNKAGK